MYRPTFNAEFAEFYRGYCQQDRDESEPRSLQVARKDLDTMHVWNQAEQGSITRSIRDSIILGASRRMAGLSEVRLIDQSLDVDQGKLRPAYELPAYDPLTDNTELASVRVSLNTNVLALLDWAEHERRLAPAEVIHEGMTIIGAVALRPSCVPVIATAPAGYFKMQDVTFERFSPAFSIPDSLPPNWQ